MTIQRQTPTTRRISDLFALLYFAAILGADGWVLSIVQAARTSALDGALGVVAVLSTHLLVVALLRLAVPVPRAGTYLVRASGGYLVWMASEALARVALQPVLRFPFWSFHFGRWVYLKALGADLELDVTIPHSVVIRDPSLLMMESGSQLEHDVRIEPGLHGAGRLVVDRIVVGGGSLVGAHSFLGPGAAIGEDARVGPEAFVGHGCRIGVGAFIGERAVLEGRVDVGSYAMVGAGSVIAGSVRIGERAKVVAGSSLPPGAQLDDRQVWAGSPSLMVESFSPPTPPVPLPLNLLMREEELFGPSAEDAPRELPGESVLSESEAPKEGNITEFAPQLSENRTSEAPQPGDKLEASKTEMAEDPRPVLPREDTDQVRQRERARGRTSEETPVLSRLPPEAAPDDSR